MNVRGALVHCGVILAVAGLIVASACDALSIPSKDCHANRTNRFDDPDTGTNVPATTECAKCLNAKCCDDVGRCEEREGCRLQVIEAHECVSANRPEEARCIQTLDDLGRGLYQCMRRSCGVECDVPSCDVEKSAALIGTPDCDRCITASCCPEINECYGNRRCKLIIECISQRCDSELGPLFSEFGAKGDSAIDAGTLAACTPFANGAGPPPIGADCIQGCLDAFATADGGPYDDTDARCKAYAVYACASRPSHNCGARCRVEKPVDASIDSD